MVHRHTERRADGILPAVALADGVLLVILAVEVEAQIADNLLGLLRQTILLHQWHHGQLYRSQRCRQMQHHAGIATLELFLLIAVAHHAQEHAVHSDTGFDDVRCIALVCLGVKVFNLLTAVLGMLRQVKVGAAVNAFHLLKPKGHVKLDVTGRIGIVGQLLMVVEPVVLRTESQCLVPLHAGLLPTGEPVQFGSRLHEILHLHLLKLTHTENELTGHDFIAESLAYLCYAERQLHAACLLHIKIVHKDALSRLGTQVYLAGALSRRAHLGGEHQVELAHLGPVACAANRAYDFLVEDNLAQFAQITGIHRLGIAFVQGFTLGGQFQHAGACSPVLCLVELFLETLAGLGHFLVYLFIILCNLILNEHIGTIAFLAVTVVDERVVEGIHVSAGLPCGWVHEDGCIYAHDVLVEQHHALPPILFDVVLQFHTVLAVIIHGAQSVIDVATGEHKTVFLAVRNYFFEYIFLCHNPIFTKY